MCTALIVFLVENMKQFYTLSLVYFPNVCTPILCKENIITKRLDYYRHLFDNKCVQLSGFTPDFFVIALTNKLLFINSLFYFTLRLVAEMLNFLLADFHWKFINYTYL